jgi:tetratricopeptide (TPR) repeat protein
VRHRRGWWAARALHGPWLLLTLCGCNMLSDQQRLCLTSGEQAFQAKQYDAARQRLTQFLSEVHDRPEVARALYVRGMAAALSGHRPAAYADLQRAARESRDPQTTWQPHVVLGVLYFEDENWLAAAQVLTEAAARMPTAPPLDAVLFRLAMCHERLGRWEGALPPCRRIAAELPRSPYADDAARRLQLRASCFAVQCGVFTRADNASALVARLGQVGFKPYVRQEPRGGNTYHVVLEGRYASYAQALQALAHVKGYVPEAVLWP